MELSITLSPESIRVLKEAVVPQESPLFGPNVEPDAIAEKVVEQLGYAELADHIDMAELSSEIDMSSLASEVSDNISMRDLADEIDVDWESIAGYMDLSDVASEVADKIDTEDVATLLVDKIDMSDLALRVSEEIDMDKLVESVSAQAVALHLVKHFVNNGEFRDCFVDALVERLAENLKI